MNNYYQIEIKSKTIKRFINRLLKSNINIYEIKYFKDKILIKCNYEDFKKIKKITYTEDIKIIKVYGKKKIIDYIKKYNIFLIGFILSIITIYILSNIIFFIEIDSNKELKALIKGELDKYDLKIYKFKNKNKKLNYVEEKIKEDLKNKIEWIELKQEGIYLKISVVERIKDKKIEQEKINDIIASQDGYIVDIYSSSGELLKVKGDYVKKGEVIISGNIHRNENIISQTSAKGEVYAKVWYKVKLNKSMYYENIKKDDIGYKKIYINILGKDINLIKYRKEIDKEYNKEIFNTSILKLKIQEEKNKIIKKEKYKENILKKQLKDKAHEEIENMLQEKEYIIEEKTLKSYIEDDKMYVEVFFEVYKNIAKYKEIPIEEIKKDD